MREESPYPGRDGGWNHVLRDRDYDEQPRPRRQSAPLPVDVDPSRLSAPAHDRIARELQRLLRLDPVHREALLARGMDDIMIARAGYRSLRPRNGALLKQVCQAVPAEDVLRFPGVVRKANGFGDYLTFAARHGLLIPVRNVERQIVGYRVRPDDPGEGGKYRWLSTPNGPSPGAPVHVARPFVVKEAKVVWVTEGEIKADIVAARLGLVCLSIPGATVTSAVPGIVARLHEQAGFTGTMLLDVVLAFDADKHDPKKAAVLNGERRLARELRGICRVFEASWPAEAAKGIDDLLVGADWENRLHVSHYPTATVAEKPVEIRNGHASQPPEQADVSPASRAEAAAAGAWSVEPVVRGIVEKSKWCMKARLFFMGGSGMITEGARPCGRWTCGECAQMKLREVILPHIVGLWKNLDALWIQECTADESATNLLNDRVRRSRRDGRNPRYVRVRRQPTGGFIDGDVVDLSDRAFVVSTDDLGTLDSPYHFIPILDAYNYVREHVLCVPGIVKINFCKPWKLLKVEKPECKEFLVYTKPSTLEEEFEKFAEIALDQFGVRPVYKCDIPQPDVRKFMYDALKNLRRPDNNIDYSDLADEEWDG